VRVIVADDSLLLREGLSRLLAEAGFDVIGQAADGDELIALVQAEPPDVAIVDIRMPPTHTDEGLQAARVIRERWPRVGILVLSQFARPSYAFELLQTGPVGRARPGRDPLKELTDREREVLGLMAEGRSNKAVAHELVITEHTVEKHVTSLMGKLQIPASADDHRRVLAVLTFLDSA